MSSESVQETLDRILAGLKSSDTTRQLAALRELETIKFSSEAIILHLEKLVLQGNGAVQKLALAALDLETSQFATSKSTALTKTTRQIILNEIAEWVEDGLIEPVRAEVLRRHYDFDIKRGTPIKPAVPQKEPGEVKPVEKVIPTPTVQPAQKAASAIPAKPAAPPKPKRPPVDWRKVITEAATSGALLRA
ncbi:MAG TPA: hypothetical protein VMJ90_00755, partial [Anaerolineales bacterium]|nr:hypothetical protein [Anaerolineales bacterium]